MLDARCVSRSLRWTRSAKCGKEVWAVGVMHKDLMHRFRVGAMAGACVLLLSGAIFESTFQCEEAIAHLQSCCPDLYATNVCGDGCNPVNLEGGESQCILDRDCDELDKADVCDRVEELSLQGSEAEEKRTWVCP